MARDIIITKDFRMPKNSVVQKFAWIGTSGGGKTYGAMRFAEEIWDLKAQFVVLDPVGVWYGLRLDEKGKKPSNINIPVFGGLHGDVPLEATSGALIADLIIDKNISAIIDVSQFESDAEKARFATAFAKRFFFRKKSAPSAVHIFIEECQEFVPQNPQREENLMLHEFTRMQKIGRNFGIGMSLITQRPQEVSKRVLNLSGTLFAFRTTGSHERKAIELWMKDNSVEDDFLNDLPKLETGCPHVWSPEFLKISKVIRILKKRTFDASATPEVGAKAVVRDLAPIDLEKIKSDMAATIEKAKADDPKELKKKISELEAAARKAKPAPVDTGAIDRAVRATEERVRREAQGTIATLRATLTKAATTLRKIADIATSEAMLKEIENFKKDTTPERRVSFGVDLAQGPKEKSVIVRAEHKTDGTTEITDVSEISGPEQKVLNAIAWMNSIGVPEPDKAAVGFVAGYSPTSSGFQNACGALRTKGLVSYPAGGAIVLTDSGREVAEVPEGVRSNEDLHEKIPAKLPGPERQILKALLEIRSEIHKEELATRIEKSWTSSGFQNACGRLRSLGLVKYPGPNMIQATEILFPL